ncbi:Ferric iron ABC transporter, permease protein [Caenispirillum salinarum AK4]|uniref:Ferric iron ABC transporter, permease protein n=1 Tax=Caenispirillum salinarum AK4 TaxID=1238182 RepID=K9HMR0_9PROT|nr:iron ABC transporter permease [Caenispirillum salinarum]EKV31588.1 Ferric iron ABC transporter, permease protein [Caenispirillum salinarum AK4]
MAQATVSVPEYTGKPEAGLAAIARRRATGSRWWTIAVLLVALLISLPVLVVVGHVGVDTGEVWSHLYDTVLWRYIGNSLGLMFGVGAGVLLLGVSTAWIVTICRFPGVRLFEWALLLPLAVPAYVIAYTYTGLLDYAGPVQEALRAVFGWQSRRDYWFPEIRSLGGAITMMSLVLYPYVYMMARAAFLEQSVCALEASRVLGCGRWRSFFRVALPMARPAIVAGTALALMETLNDFGTVDYFAVDTFTTGIYRTWFGLGEPAAAAQLGAVLMLFIFVLVLMERWSRGQAGYQHTSTRIRVLPRVHLTGWKMAGAILVCTLPLALGFLIPVLVLAQWAVDTWSDVMSGGRFFDRAANSFILAGVAAVLAAAVGVLLAYGQRMRKSRMTLAAARVASLGYAVPGSVIAVGVLVPLTAFDNALDRWMEAVFGFGTGLLLTGSIAALVYAYLVRFLAVSFNAIEASLGKVTQNLEGAARTLGLGPWATLKRVHLPMIRGSILTAALLVFVDVMKELPATLIMRPFNFDTLAVRAYELASDERLQEAAPAALAIVLVGIVPVVLLSVAIARSRPGSAR